MKTKQSIVDSLLFESGLKPVEIDAGLRVRILRIGKREAQALLKANTDNRKLRPGRVRFYSNTMKEGGWKLTHQGIAFTSAGLGIDLQHRLNAVIDADAVIDIMVTEGLGDDAFIAIDQHERRSVADALKVDRKVTEEAKFFIHIMGGAMSNNPTNAQVGEMCAEIHADSAYLRSVCGTTRKLMSSTPIRCAAIITMIQYPRLRGIVSQTYRNLVLHETESWSKTMHAFGRQVASGDVRSGGGRERIDLFSRGLIVFDPTKANLSKIQISEARTNQDAERVISVFGGSLYSASE